VLTPDERRGALLVLGLLLLGGAWDLVGVGRSPASRAPHSELRGMARDPAGEPGASASDRPDPGAGDVAAGVAEAPAPARSLDPAAPVAPNRPVSLNRASAAELETLPGIGPVLAGRIVEYRSRFGRFASVEELRAVRGVGPRLLERLKGRVTADP